MSRRAPQGPDRAEQNRATLKQLVKIESNKSCADCKRNKHPRWASWNLGVFVCIRCSGIHRGMGTHISRVKSVDLDSWTDEQMGNMLRWGNARANKYWEAKLAEGHVPNEAKIENFIRTKYDSKRWVMDGPMPDPSTLDDGTGDDDVPLNVVREKAIERAGSVKNGTSIGAAIQPPRERRQEVDLFGESMESAPARPSTTEPTVQRPGPPKAPVAPPKQTRPGESLLGLDFFGGTQSAPPNRPSSTGPNATGVPGRADLKSSILSLYASKPAAPPQSQPQSSTSAFGGIQSPGQSQSNAQSLGGLGDAFGSLSFDSPVQQSQQKSSPFANLTSPTSHTRQTSASKSALSGGSFFDMSPAVPPKATPTSPPSQFVAATRSESFGGDFGDFSTAASTPAAPVKPALASSSNMGDLFDLSEPVSATASAAPPALQSRAPPPIEASSYIANPAFNLSQPSAAAPAATPAAAPRAAQTTSLANLSMADPWGSNDAWATPDPPAASQAPPPPAKPQPPQIQPSTIRTTQTNFTARAPPAVQTPFDAGWGEEPKPFVQQSAGGFNVQQDEEFGGWSHASPIASTPGAGKQGGGGSGGNDDLFGNVWG